MTNREFFTAIANSELNDELKTFALESIEKLDKKNASRSSKPNKRTIANEPIKNAILELLANGAPMSSVDIASAISTEETPISYNKVNGIARGLVESGALVKSKAKVKGKGEVTFYTVA